MIVLKKKQILALILSLALFLALVFGVPAAAMALSPRPKFVVVVDAGHGGVDGGAVGVRTGVCERELNLQVAFKLKNLLEKAGVGVIMTRTTRAGLYDGLPKPGFKTEDMKKRLEIIKNSGATLAVSIHMNTYSSPNRRGAQVFFTQGFEASKELAGSIQNNLNRALNEKHLKRGFTALKGDYYLLNYSSIPTVIVECGFLSSPLDEQLLISESYQDELAYQICSGILSYLYTN